MTASARPACPRSAPARVPETLSLSLGVLALGLNGCGVRDSELIVSGGDAAPPLTLPAEVIRAIDERPIGGASLTTGTRGGGTYAEARAAGSLHLVTTLGELAARVGGDSPAVIVVAQGTYLGAGEPRIVKVCHQACEADDPVLEQTLTMTYCTHGEAIIDAMFTTDQLRVGSNKTIIGLGGGARLADIEVVLDGSSNVILRNLAIEDVQRGVLQVGNGLSLEAADHVWLDHLTLRDISRTALDIVSSWDEENAQALVKEAGYITVSAVHFDGFVSASCSQRSELVLTTNRNPALTVTRSWFDGGSIRVPNLFGPGTWAHLFNNLWSDIDGRGLAVSCGAAALAQGNVFQATHNALYNSEPGSSTWQFCVADPFGKLYAPMGASGVERNLLDASSSMSLAGQPSNGPGLDLPMPVAGTDFALNVPVASGTKTETYSVTLAADPATVATDVPVQAGVGRLF